jgi:hypothetical protein
VKARWALPLPDVALFMPTMSVHFISLLCGVTRSASFATSVVSGSNVASETVSIASSRDSSLPYLLVLRHVPTTLYYCRQWVASVLYRVIEKFLRSGKIVASNLNVACRGTFAEKLYDHPVETDLQTCVTVKCLNSAVTCVAAVCVLPGSSTC